jgi:hypothetical protein
MRVIPLTRSGPCASFDSIPTLVGLGVVTPMNTDRKATNTST